jgi:hypothetical protein
LINNYIYKATLLLVFINSNRLKNEIKVGTLTVIVL